jgi:hypothetical protein
MNSFRSCSPAGISLANVILVASTLTACGAPVGDSTAQSGSDLSAPDAQPANLLAGPWTDVASPRGNRASERRHLPHGGGLQREPLAGSDELNT